MEELGFKSSDGGNPSPIGGKKFWLKKWPWRYLPSVHTGLVLHPRQTSNLYYVRLWKKSMPRKEKWMSLYEDREGFQHKSTPLHMPCIKLGVLLSLPASPISWAWPSKENTILIFRLTLLTSSAPDLGNSHTERMWKTAP